MHSSWKLLGVTIQVLIFLQWTRKSRVETTETSFGLRSCKSKFPDTEWFIVSHGLTLRLKRRFINLFIAPPTHDVVSAKFSVAPLRNVKGSSREPENRTEEFIQDTSCLQTVFKQHSKTTTNGTNMKTLCYPKADFFSFCHFRGFTSSLSIYQIPSFVCLSLR